ncbi:hypothetical protein ABAZ39_20955 (plasmid) [Azospirillum argentinense]|uniref:Uncharacterized protein n=1 Tax=Azospirillum argentinense TaxID=2970906 RepID=A0A060DTA6_9PROT|nr:hypothetical protein ABAZ39_20955 [Azospirillum argentinense]
MAPPMVTVTVLPASAVPVRVGVALSVSVAEVTAGALGAVVSMVSDWVPAEEVLPAASVAVAETAFVPLALRLSEPAVGVAVARLTLQAPVPEAVVV